MSLQSMLQRPSLFCQAASKIAKAKRIESPVFEASLAADMVHGNMSAATAYRNTVQSLISPASCDIVDEQ